MIKSAKENFHVIAWRTFSALCLLLAMLMVENGAHGGTSINQFVAICSPTIPANCQSIGVSGGALMSALSKTLLPGAALTNTTANLFSETSTGYLVTVPYSIPETTWQFSTAGTPITTATTTAIQAAGATNVRNYMTGLQIMNNGSAGTEVQILDGAAIIWDGQLGASLGSPVNIAFEVPLRGTPATSMSIKTISGVTISVTVSAQGYQAY